MILASPSFLPAAEELKPLDFGTVTEKHLWVPMRDGVRLSGYAYFPAGDGPWPVLFQQRYNSHLADGSRRAAAYLAGKGYVVVNVNFRGTQLSEGTFVGYRALGWGELKDGYDTCEWVAVQPWSNGKVGTFGNSQGALSQNFLAVTQPPHLVAQYMIDTVVSLFHGGYRIGGITRSERFKRMDDVTRQPGDNRALMREWFKHPTYDDYWAQEDPSRHFGEMNVPCFTIGSYYDYMCSDSIQSYIGRQHRGGPNSRGKQQLLLGPWPHAGSKPNTVGELTYPANAAFSLPDHMVRWFDYYLKGIDTGVTRDAPVRYYVMGATGEPKAPGNVWREAADWPVATKPTPYYFHGRDSLSTAQPAEENTSTTYTSDPLNPAKIPGFIFPGARDAREFEKQPNVLTFSTEVLQEPVEWTGKVSAELYVSSTARDTDFIVRVTDVYPDGRSILIIDQVRRARYREGFDREVFMNEGKVYKVAFDVGWLSLIFNRGHRIRITVASNGASFYEPNPNTGEPLTMDFPAKVAVAQNTIYHNRQYSSHVIAPIPR